MLGHYVVVYGPASSGKTTLARRIAGHIGVPHIELDALFWKPGWVETPPEEFRADVSAVLGKHPHGWVVDGNYLSRMGDVVLSQVDTVVWIRLPLRVVFWWALKRTVFRIWKRELLWGHSRETFRNSFLSRGSLLFYIVMNWRRHSHSVAKSLEEIPHHARVIELYSRREVATFVADLSGTKNASQYGS